jgi:methyl-accepting chemotaxis protein
MGLKMKSIKHDTIWRKFLLSAVLMSLLPILLLLYIVYFSTTPREEINATQIRWLIFWIVCSSLVGFWITKNMIKSFVQLSKGFKTVANGNYSVQLEKTDEAGEIDELSKAFNKITSRLEDNIRELQRSKRLIQDILSRVGRAVASFQDIDKFLELIVITTIETIGAKNGKLMLTDEEQSELTTKISVGKEQIQSHSLKIGEGFLGSVVKKGKPVVLPKSES